MGSNRLTPWYVGCIACFVLLVLSDGVVLAQADDYELGRSAYNEGDFDQALAYWRPMAEQGDKRAQFSLGSMFFDGFGVPQDQTEAASWFRRSAEQGYKPAQFNLGNAYKHGQGIVQNDTEAANWWQRAADQDFAPAQFNLGTQYYFGRGVAKDEKQAMYWYQRAAKNGHKRAIALFEAQQAVDEQNSAGSPAARVSVTAQTSSTEATVSNAETVASVEPLDDSWFLAREPGKFTLQLAAFGHRDGVDKFINKKGLQGAAVFRFLKDGQYWYAVTVGEHGSRDEATSAVKELPTEAQNPGPWIRPFSDIQTLIRSASGN